MVNTDYIWADTMYIEKLRTIHAMQWQRIRLDRIVDFLMDNNINFELNLESNEFHDCAYKLYVRVFEKDNKVEVNHGDFITIENGKVSVIPSAEFINNWVRHNIASN